MEAHETLASDVGGGGENPGGQGWEATCQSVELGEGPSPCLLDLDRFCWRAPLSFSVLLWVCALEGEAECVLRRMCARVWTTVQEA